MLGALCDHLVEKKNNCLSRYYSTHPRIGNNKNTLIHSLLRNTLSLGDMIGGHSTYYRLLGGILNYRALQY